MEEQRVAVVTVNYRTPDLVMRCLESLAAERTAMPHPLEVIVVDGGSGDGSAEQLRRGLADERFAGWTSFLPLELNGGFGWANNQAMLLLLQRDQPPSLIHILNPDTVVEPGAIGALVEVLKTHPDCGAAGSQLIDADHAPAGSAFRFPTPARELIRGSNTPALGRLLGIAPILVRPGYEGEVDWVTGASVMFRAEALCEAGLFDDGFFLYFEEIELMHRLRRRGWTVRHVPRSRVYHVGGASTGVNGHDPEQVKRRPAYWYRSRRRFFALTAGRFGALMAGLAWLIGDSLWQVRRALSRSSTKIEVPNERQDILVHGLRATASDLTPNARNWRDAAGTSPAWERAEPSFTTSTSRQVLGSGSLTREDDALS